MRLEERFTIDQLTHPQEGNLLFVVRDVMMSLDPAKLDQFFVLAIHRVGGDVLKISRSPGCNVIAFISDTNVITVVALN